MVAILMLGGLGVVVLSLLMAYYYHVETSRQASTPSGAPDYERQLRATDPGYNPRTRRWEDRDGTPYGAIDADLGG